MTDFEKLTMLKAVLDDKTAEDDVLLTYLHIAGDKIIARAYPYARERKDVPFQYEGLQIEIASYLYNKRGAEGEITHTENTITRQYQNADIPASMLRQIVPFCGGIF